MAEIEVFHRLVPRRAVIGFIGADADAISVELKAAAETGDSRILPVVYALDLLNPISRMRSRRDLIAARHRGMTVLLASYREDLLQEICDEIWWIEDGAVKAQGDPSEVLIAWQKHNIDLWRQEQSGAAPPMEPALSAGDGRARILSVQLCDSNEALVGGWKSGEAAAIHVVVEFVEPVTDPVIGILIRTRIGLNVYGTNTELERLQLGPRAAGDKLHLTFRFPCDLCPGEYTLTAASHDPDGVWHEWLDDVVAFTVGDVRYTAGVANLRAIVEWSLVET